MTAAKPTTYAAAVAAANSAVALARLNDPGEHFPYKADHVRALLAENPAMGPEGGDDVRFEDYMSADIAAASAAMIEAQADHLVEGTTGSRDDYRQAQEALVAARQAHRVNRPAGGMVVGVRSRRAGE